MKTIRTEEELVEAKATLLRMQADPSFITKSAYRADREKWSNNRMPFIDIHMEYLKTHPEISLRDYISNLRLKLRKTGRY